MLKKEFDCTTQRGWGLAIGLVIGVFIGFAAGVTLSDKAVGIEISWAEVVTACGTVGAVIAALGLHFHNRKAEENERLLKAKLYALSKRVQLQYLKNLSNKISELNFSLVSTKPGEREGVLSLLSQFIEDFNEAYDGLGLTLEALAPLKHGVASNLAIGISQANQGVKALRIFLSLVSQIEEKRFQQEVMINHAWLSGGASIMECGFTELDKIASEFVKKQF